MFSDRIQYEHNGTAIYFTRNS